MNIPEAIRFLRLLFPHLRCTRQFCFALNTSVRKNMRCVFCGAEGPSWCARWPKTSVASAWEAEHDCNPLEGILNKCLTL